MLSRRETFASVAVAAIGGTLGGAIFADMVQDGRGGVLPAPDIGWIIGILLAIAIFFATCACLMANNWPHQD